MRALIIVLLLTATATAETAKSERTALALSLAPTLGGIALITTGAVLEASSGCIGGNCTNHDAIAVPFIAVGVASVVAGPTVGHIYAGDTLNRGLAIRGIGIGLGVVGAAIAASNVQMSCGGERSCARDYVVAGLLVVGGGTYLTGTVIEIASTPGAVRARNSYALRPILRRDIVGVAVRGAF